MRILVDAQLPPALARWLAARGHEASHVADLGLASASDQEIWTYALNAGATVITKDEDFAQRKVLEQDGPPIVWVRLPNSRKRDLLRWFEAALPLVEAALARGETLIEVV
jgi:predicted nuclease of predicted toxin-antitoxin system